MIFNTQNGPPAHVIDAMSGVQKWTKIGEEVITLLQSPKKNWTDRSVHRGGQLGR